MAKRLQIYLSPEAEIKLETIYNEVTQGFTAGNIKQSDLVSEMILSSQIDVKDLRLKYTDFKKSLIELAHTDNLDIEIAIKALQDLKNKISKIKAKNTKLVEVEIE